MSRAARQFRQNSLLAMIVFEAFGRRRPPNRQAERCALEGAPIALSTMADAAGAICAALDPLPRRVEGCVMAAERFAWGGQYGPRTGEGRTYTGRIWACVRDDRPFAGAGPPAAIVHGSHNRRGEPPPGRLSGHAGIRQADAHDGCDFAPKQGSDVTIGEFLDSVPIRFRFGAEPCSLSTFHISQHSKRAMVEPDGIEPTTSSMPLKRSPN